MKKALQLVSLLRRCVVTYFDSYAWPIAVLVVAVVVECALLYIAASQLPLSVGGGVVALCALGLVAAGVWNMWRSRYGKGVLNLAIPVLSVLAVVWIDRVAFNEGHDDFADHLKIPSDLEIAEPIDRGIASVESPSLQNDDSFQQALLRSLDGVGSDDASVAVSAEALSYLSRSHPDLLRRYLAANAAWRVFEERGNVYATRRWRMGDEWQYSLHGYYSNFAESPRLQSRVTLGLTGEPWVNKFSNATQLQSGISKSASTTRENDLWESVVVLSVGATIEVFEQSDAKERRLTKTVFAQLEQEMRPLANSPTWDTARSLLVPHSITRSGPSIELHNSFQPGIYNVAVRANAGEAGRIYLKAFEVTQRVPLSLETLKDYSGEWLGWSDDSNEQFLANAHITIYEGDWGFPYAARFEVWFVPASGAPERKLMERNFRIEGWQR